MVERALVEHGWLRTGDKGTIDPHEQLKCLVVVTKVWTVDNDLITPLSGSNATALKTRMRDTTNTGRQPIRR